MEKTSWAIPLLIVGITAACVSRSPSHTTQAGAGGKQKVQLAKFYFGVKDCRRCHTEPGTQDPILCKCNEVLIWEKQDKHRFANDMLKGDRAKQMAALLKIKNNVWEEPSCVSCHGVLIEDPKTKDKTFDLAEGVNCVACHGPHKEWVAAHAPVLAADREKWQAMSRQEKHEKYGMTDLWDPVQRATTCASCHIGSVEEKKVVTHEMYAAGHPPLPGIEVALFSEAMPRHWDYLYEKRPEVQKILGWDPSKHSLEKTELVVLAGLVSFRETMNLIADQAELGEKAKGPDSPWPELAHFDCYACHHDLKSKSWRQERGYEGIPGRPNMRPWSLTLLDLGIHQTGGGKLEADFQAKKKKLIEAYDAQPFGDPTKVRAAARDLSQWSDQVIAAVRNSQNRIDLAAAGKLLVRLGETAKQQLDYDSARQVSWAFLIIHREINPSLWDNRRDSKLDIIQSKDPEITKRFHELDQLLTLKLPQGQVRIEDHLPDNLSKIANYKPGDFRPPLEGLLRRVKQGMK